MPSGERCPSPSDVAQPSVRAPPGPHVVQLRQRECALWPPVETDEREERLSQLRSGEPADEGVDHQPGGSEDRVRCHDLTDDETGQLICQAGVAFGACGVEDEPANQGEHRKLALAEQVGQQRDDQHRPPSATSRHRQADTWSRRSRRVERHQPCRVDRGDPLPVRMAAIATTADQAAHATGERRVNRHAGKTKVPTATLRW